MRNDSTERARAFMRMAGGIVLVLFPLALMLAFALHFDSISEFFEFQLRYEPNTASEFMATLSNPNEATQYTVAHGVGYLSLPLLVGAGLCLGYILFRTKPWIAIIGTSLVCIGAIYMGGVFGSWLSFAAIGNVASDQLQGAIPALEALTEMQGALLLTSMLSALSLVGMMVLAVGLFLGQVVPRWSAALIFIGNLTILVFTDLDNWMFIGALLMLLGMVPITWRLLNKGFETEPEAG